MKKSFDNTNFDTNYPYKISTTNIKHFKLHWHPYVEIFYCIKGAIRITTNDISFNLDEGHICFINSGVIHSIEKIEIDNVILVLQISNLESGIFHTLKSLKFNHESYLSDLASNKLPLEELQQILLQIYKEDFSKAPGYKNVVLSLIHALISILIRQSYLIPKSKSDYILDNDLERLTNIITYLDKNYMNKISLQDIAKQNHMNYYYLSHFFKNTAGISFQKYLNNLRLDKSLSMLIDPNSNITKTALDSGFPNIKSYTSAFKEKYGVLPSKYRNDILMRENTNNSIYKNFIINELTDSSSLLFNYDKRSNSLINLFKKIEINNISQNIITEYIDIQFNNYKNSLTHTKNKRLQLKNINPFFCNIDNIAKVCNLLDTNLIELNHSSLDITQFIENETNSFSYLDKLKSLLIHKTKNINFDNSILIKDDLFCSIPENEQNIQSNSLLHASSILKRYFTSPQIVPTPILMSNINMGNSNILLGLGYNLITENGIPTPGLFVYKFLNQLSENIIFIESNCIITECEDEIQILCYHSKSYEDYLRTTIGESFNTEKYNYFINSFPTLKLNFCFKEIKHKIKKISYELSVNNGSILDNWIKLGSPDNPSIESLEYLKSITSPAVYESIIPFSETPIVSVELSPLGCTFIRLIKL